MRLDGGTSKSGVNDPEFIFPEHFSKYYPNLVEFFEIYVNSLYSSDISSGQLTEMWTNESWWNRSGEVFISLEERNISKAAGLVAFRANYGISNRVVNLIEDKTLERDWVGLSTIDGFSFISSDVKSPEFRKDNYFHIKNWLQGKGLTELAEVSNDGFRCDMELFIKISRNLFKMRGSMQCAKVYFEALYGGNAVITFPRDKISTLDDNFEPDGTVVLRDDLEFDEFTYVVNLVGSNYSKLGDKFVDMYLRVFHAAGFRCLIKVYSDIEWSLVSGEADRFPDYIETWKQFFEGKFAVTMRGLENG